MSGLPIVVTSAGRAALVNAANTGTLPVTVAKIGVTATGFTANPAGSDVALPGELKQLSTFGGAAVSPDTIHVTLRDDGADVYSMRGFGLYLADGTLFALYGQAAVILEKSAQAMMVLSADIRFVNVDATSIVFGDANFINPPATTEVQGVIEIATDAEAITGTDPGRAVAPKGLKAALDDRLGAGAPSTFVKGLLTLATAALFRTALAIKGAALYDVGHDNNLDADLLDGQHGAYYRAYGSLTGIPAAFPPLAHAHAWGDLTGVPATATRWPDWGEVTGKPLTFTPAPHSHPTSDIIGLDGALAARPLQTSVTAQISAAVNALIDGAPGAIDTLNELAAAMGDDPNFAATVTNALATKAGLTANNNFTGANTFTGPSAFNLSGAIDARATFNVGGARRGLLAVSGVTGVGSFVVYAADGGTALGQLDIGNGGMKYSGAVTLTCTDATDTITVNTPGSSPAGSFIQFTSPGSAPGVVGQFGTTKRRDIIFGNAGLQIAVSAGTGGVAPQYTFGESGNLSTTGAFSCLTFNATGSDIRLKDDVAAFAPRPLHRLLAALPDTHGAIASYTHRVDRAYRIGPIAQDMERIEPAYMGAIDIEEGQVEGIAAGRYKTVDKASAAYEQAMWAGQEIDRLLARIEALEAR